MLPPSAGLRVRSEGGSCNRGPAGGSTSGGATRGTQSWESPFERQFGRWTSDESSAEVEPNEMISNDSCCTYVLLISGFCLVESAVGYIVASVFSWSQDIP